MPPMNMKVYFKIFLRALVMLILSKGLTSTTFAQEVSIQDPGLNAAIRAALQKPTGPLSQQDLLSLTNLDASNRNITNVAGLEAARNLVSLHLEFNSLTNFALPTALTNLALLNLSVNPLIQCLIPSGLTNLSTLVIEGTPLRNFTLPV